MRPSDRQPHTFEPIRRILDAKLKLAELVEKTKTQTRKKPKKRKS